jgi:hypothetical protein
VTVDVPAPVTGLRTPILRMIAIGRRTAAMLSTSRCI